MLSDVALQWTLSFWWNHTMSCIAMDFSDVQFYLNDDFSYFLVNKKGEVSEIVQNVLKQEMDKLYFGKDAKTLNSEFMDCNNNSILHRLAGLSRSVGFMAKMC